MSKDENSPDMSLLASLGVSIPGVIFQFKLKPDSTYSFPWITEGIESRTGISFTQIKKDPKVLFDKIEPDDRKAIWQAIRESASSLQKIDIQFRMVADPVPASHPVLNGWVWKTCRANPQRREDGSILWTGVILDITKSKEMEEKLKESEETFRSIFESSPYAIMHVDLQGKIIDCNKTTLTLHEYSDKSELLGKPSFALIAPKEHARVMENLAQCMTLGTVKDIECTFITKNGREFLGDLSSSLIYDSSGNLKSIIAIGRDVSELKKAQEARFTFETKLQQTQKLESLGLLAGGIAHDFNNLLTGILGYTSLSLLELPRASPLRDYLVQIETSTRHAADLTRQLLAYSGRGRFQVQGVRVDQLVHDMASLLQLSISKKNKLQYHFESNLPPIEVDTSQFGQMAMNLILNASEAIGDKSGEITISTGTIFCTRAMLDGLQLGEHCPEGRYVFLEVKDQGCGMSREVQAKMFDPFFTTKLTGRGLGLAAVQGIMRGHHGAIDVQSAPDRGTSIRLLFPESNKPIKPADLQGAAKGFQRGSGTILAVDDDETVRTLAYKVLSDAGYKVLLAQDGRQAVEMFLAREDAIQLVLLDLTMPGLDGIETLKELRKAQPNIRVVLSSGYSGQDVAERFEGFCLNGFLQKPYTAFELRSAVEKGLKS